LANLEDPRTILDFGAGAGRVTRWLKAAFPDSRIHACDVRPQDMQFVRASIGVEASTVGPSVDDLTIPGRYDLVWVGSVITHFSEPATRTLVTKLLSVCNPCGLLVLSFHGRYAIERHESGDLCYIHDEGWQRIKSGYVNDGYGYADYQGQSGYGISVCTAQWFLQFVQQLNSARLVSLSERAWDEHHDIVAIQRLRQ
jgi:SAM-dependent methyltransferase